MNIAKSVLSRLFLLEDGAHPKTKPEYLYFISTPDVEESFGEIEGIFAPDPNTGKPVLVGTGGSGERDQHTVSVNTRYLIDNESTLSKVAGTDRRHDFHIHFGQCENPSAFNDFKGAVILEDAVVATVSRSDMGALSSDENEASSESADIIAGKLYHAHPLAAHEVLFAPKLGLAIEEFVASYNHGRKKWRLFALDGTGMLYYSGDSGGSWQAFEFDGWVTDTSPTGGLAISDKYLIALQTTGTYYYIDYNDFEQDTPPSPTAVSLGHSPTGIGNLGGIHSCGSVTYITSIIGDMWRIRDSNIDQGFFDQVLHSGTITTGPVYQIRCLTEDFVVVGGNDGAIGFTENGGTSWTLCTNPVFPGNDIRAIELIDLDLWFIGLSDGRIMFTEDKGSTWQLSYSHSSSILVKSISFVTRNIGYASLGGGPGVIIKTYNGGYSWVEMPDNGGDANALTNLGSVSLLALEPNLAFAGGSPATGEVPIVSLGTNSPVRDPVDYVNRVLELDPTVYWRLNEDPGVTTPSGRVYDQTTNGYYIIHSTFPDAEYESFPPNTDDYTVRYNGTSDYTTINNANFYPVGVFNGALYTISVWIRIYEKSTWPDIEQRTIIRLGKDIGNTISIYKNDADGFLTFTHRAGAGAVETVTESVGQPTSWAHVAMVVDQWVTPNPQWRAYFNGEEIGEIANSNCDAWSGPLMPAWNYIGVDLGITGFWKGGIAHMSIFDRALTPAQILDLADIF